jgi:hypothetical protein
MCGAFSIVSTQDGHRSDSTCPMRFKWLRVGNRLCAHLMTNSSWVCSSALWVLAWEFRSMESKMQSCVFLQGRAVGCASNGNEGFRSRDKRDNVRRVGHVVEAVGGASIGVTLHLCFGRKVFDGSFFILVTFFKKEWLRR